MPGRSPPLYSLHTLKLIAVQGHQNRDKSTPNLHTIHCYIVAQPLYIIGFGIRLEYWWIGVEHAIKVTQVSKLFYHDWSTINKTCFQTYEVYCNDPKRLKMLRALRVLLGESRFLVLSGLCSRLEWWSSLSPHSLTFLETLTSAC